MALTRQQKAEQIAQLKEKFTEAKSVVFAHYIGLKVSQVSALRAKLKLENAEMKVGKKSLIRLVAKEIGAPELSEDALPGAVACIFSTGNPVSGASVAFAFGKDHEPVKLVGGIFDGKFLSKAEVISFAQLPNKLTLLGTFAMMLNTPLTQFASACSSPLTGFARALAEIAKKKEAAPAA